MHSLKVLYISVNIFKLVLQILCRYNMTCLSAYMYWANASMATRQMEWYHAKEVRFGWLWGIFSRNARHVSRFQSTPNVELKRLVSTITVLRGKYTLIRYLSSFQKSRGGRSPPEKFEGGDTSPPDPLRDRLLWYTCIYAYISSSRIRTKDKGYVSMLWTCFQAWGPVKYNWNFTLKQNLREFLKVLTMYMYTCHHACSSPNVFMKSDFEMKMLSLFLTTLESHIMCTNTLHVLI